MISCNYCSGTFISRLDFKHHLSEMHNIRWNQKDIQYIYMFEGKKYYVDSWIDT